MDQDACKVQTQIVESLIRYDGDGSGSSDRATQVQEVGSKVTQFYYNNVNIEVIRVQR